jgi:hypothetical protein
MQFSLVSRLTLFNPPRLGTRPHSRQLFCSIDVLQYWREFWLSVWKMFKCYLEMRTSRLTLLLLQGKLP